MMIRLHFANMFLNKSTYPANWYEIDCFFLMMSKSFQDITYMVCIITYITPKLTYDMDIDKVNFIGIKNGYGERFDEKHHLNQGRAINSNEEDNKLLKSSHASKNYLNYIVGVKLNIMDYSVSNESYKVALTAFTSEERKIFNAGIHSNLNIFPFADYVSLVNNDSNP